MSTLDSYDGLCGIIANFASSDLQLRCNYCMGHHGPCSWEKYKERFMISSSCERDPAEYREEKFIESVLESQKKL